MRIPQLETLASLLCLSTAYAQLINRRHGQCGPTTFTIITPGPGMRPTPVTRQFQAVHSFIPDYVACNSQDRRKCVTVYKTTSYRWLSTRVPCHSGLTVVTRVNQPVTIAAYPTNRIEICHCERAGTCYYGATSTLVSRPTSFPYINSGWRYHVCKYSDYYRHISGDYSDDYSGRARGDIRGSKVSHIEGSGRKTGTYHARPRFGGESDHRRPAGYEPGNTRKTDFRIGHPQELHHGERQRLEGYKPDNQKVADLVHAPNYHAGAGVGGDRSKVAWGHGWKSLEVECRSCINGVCSSSPVSLVTKIHVQTTTQRVPYKINRYFSRRAVLCVRRLGITLTIQGPTSLSTVVTGTTTVTSTVTTTATTIIITTTTAPAAALTATTATTTTATTQTAARTQARQGIFFVGAYRPATGLAERQTQPPSFIVCVNNACVLQDTCRGAQAFRVNALQQLTNADGSLAAFANNGDIALGSALFRLGTGDITRAFSLRGNNLVWSGSNGDREGSFCVTPNNQLTVLIKLELRETNALLLNYFVSGFINCFVDLFVSYFVDSFVDLFVSYFINSFVSCLVNLFINYFVNHLVN
ncbi:hypothetical protein DRE_07280 [Drechslerella stenobrocha 248]|uniref:Sushi domain-containing protein n=1 Tax=Drechslerella stenobrocha 248 TaxID=1043628 RepID=W7HIU0_9PEZI|nr:hypothetical protein DRE_07280 [Drechslerella stenobrocha 248]